MLNKPCMLPLEIFFSFLLSQILSDNQLDAYSLIGNYYFRGTSPEYKNENPFKRTVMNYFLYPTFLIHHLFARYYYSVAAICPYGRIDIPVKNFPCYYGQLLSDKVNLRHRFRGVIIEAICVSTSTWPQNLDTGTEQGVRHPNCLQPFP